jgi:hypothetical protein
LVRTRAQSVTAIMEQSNRCFGRDIEGDGRVDRSGAGNEEGHYRHEFCGIHAAGSARELVMGITTVLFGTASEVGGQFRVSMGQLLNRNALNTRRKIGASTSQASELPPLPFRQNHDADHVCCG